MRIRRLLTCVLFIASGCGDNERSSASLVVDTVSNATTCANASPATLAITLHNAGQSAAKLGALTIAFHADANDVTSAFSQQPASANPPEVAAGGSAELKISVQYNGTTALGAVMIDAHVAATDAGSGADVGVTAAGAATVMVEVAPILTLSSVTLGTSRVSTGQSAVAVTLDVANTGSVPAMISAADLHFSSLSNNVDGDYAVAHAAGYPALAMVPASGSLALPFTVDVGANATTGQIKVDGALTGVDAACGTSPAVTTAGGAAPSWTVQSQAALAATLTGMPNAISTGQTFTVMLTVTNSGEATANAVTPTDPVASCGACVSKVSGPGVTTSDIAGGTSTTFSWTYLGNASTSGVAATLSASAAGTDDNAGTVVATSSATSTAFVVQSHSLVASTSTAAAKVSVGQTFDVSVTVTNDGEAVENAVTPVDPIASCGGCAGKLSGPDLASANLAAGASATFHWTYQPTVSTSGTAMTFAASASGTDANSGAQITTNTATSTGVVFQNPAAFSAALSCSRSQTDVGELFIVTLTLSNIGEASAQAISATSPIASCPGCVSPIAGSPGGATALDGGASTAFTWTFHADTSSAATPVTFTSAASGADANSLATLTTSTLTSNGIILQRPPLLAGAITLSSPTVGVGDTFTIRLDVTNTGEADALAVAGTPVASCGACATMLVDATPTTVPGGGAASLTWTMHANQISAGARFTISAVGVDANTAAAVGTGAVQSAAFDIAPVLPPDPATVAPAIDRTVATTIYDSTSFLYTGINPIQTGVSPGTIDAQRVAVVRGRVLDRSNNAVSGVTISVLDHPELGQTLSRADGRFDLAVNGGGPLTFDYNKAGQIAVQRTLVTPWRDWAQLPDVVMIARDSQVTTIDLDNLSSVTAARGSVVTDADGTRQATLLFSPGTTATMVIGGSTQPVTTLHVRATEFTVGLNGPKAMPGSLPPQSGYTFAAEFSVDEAIAANASTVQFNQPVYAYVENFVGVPTGAGVPSGYYDRARAVWLPLTDGRVLTIVGVTGGLVDIDTDGDGQPDSSATLATFGFTDGERATLASLYAVGTSLWRLPMMHFSPIDGNWQPDLPYGAYPRQPRPRVRTGISAFRFEPCPAKGSVIGCENQSLGEQVALAGSPYDLHYQSERTPGQIEALTADISVTGSSVPSYLKRVDVDVEVGGRHFPLTFPATPNQSYRFTWDGKDAYGRAVQGIQPAHIVIGNVFDANYLMPYRLPGGSVTWGSLGGQALGVKMRQEGTVRQDFDVSLGNWWEDRANTVGGWSVSAHHAYDPAGGTIYYGDGRVERAGSLTFDRIAGKSSSSGGETGDGGAATSADMTLPQFVRVGPDGSFYISNQGRVRRVSPTGIISTIAGGGSLAITDGMRATDAALSVGGTAIGSDGSVFIYVNDRVIRVDPAGILHIVAGNCTNTVNQGDGGPAIAACVHNHSFGNYPWINGLALGPDGSLYIAEAFEYTVRRIDPNGIITTFAGIYNSAGASGDGGKATLAKLNEPCGLAVGPDGAVYIADFLNSAIRRVGVDGIISTVAGTLGVARSGATGDGGQATSAHLYYPRDVGIGPDGTLFIADSYDCAVREVGPDGIIQTIAGAITCPYAAPKNLGFATKATIYDPEGIAVGNDGAVYIADRSWDSVYVLHPALPGFSRTDNVIPSEDGMEVYRFDARGRHLQTLDALTGTVRLSFGYDSSGQLTSITDAVGNITSFPRDASGNPMAVVAPSGQTTSLAVDANGFLASARDPSGATTSFAYTAAGLMTNLADPEGNGHLFAYDSLGRLSLDQDPAGGSTTIARTETPTGVIIARTTALGRTTTLELEQNPDGTSLHKVTGPDGAQIVSVHNTDGTASVTEPDGTVIQKTDGPDPRFGVAAPVTTNLTIVTPAQAAYTATIARTVTLSNPQNPLSLFSLRDTITVNGAVLTRLYQAPTRTLTITHPTGRKTVTVLDSLGRISSMSGDPGLNPVTVAYNGFGDLAGLTQGAQSWTYGYDANRRVNQISDALGHVTRFTRNLAGQITHETTPAGRVHDYTYDPNGDLASIAMPSGSLHSLAHDSLGYQTSYTPPGTTGSSTYSHDVDRKPLLKTLPDGRTLHNVYDAFGRFVRTDAAEDSIAFGYAGATDRLASVVRTPSAGVAQSLAFSYLGTLETQRVYGGAANGTYAYAWNKNLGLIDVLFTSGADSLHTAIVRDADGLMTQLGPFTIARTGPAGDPSAIGDGTLSASLSYDALGRQSDRQHTVAGTAVYREQLAFDKAGRIAERIDTVNGTSSVLDYVYDLDGQLVEVQQDGSVVESYTYDANGNRLTRTLGVTTDVATYDTQDRLLGQGATSYAFDVAGYLSLRNADAFAYNSRGALLSATVGAQTVTYDYDGFGRRVTRNTAAGTEEYLYGNPDALFQVTQSRDAAGVLSSWYYDDHGMLFAVSRGGSLYYIAVDPLGSPRVVADATGAIVKEIRYDAFGQVTFDSDPTFDLALGYAGGVTDPVTGLVHFGWRDYDPATGRFTARDPLHFGSGEGNVYVYAGNNPASMRDPSGLFSAGFSAYDGPGGGASVAANSEGFSVCGEIGIGIGEGITISPSGELDETGVKVVAEAESVVGPAALSVKVPLDECFDTENYGFNRNNFKHEFEVKPLKEIEEPLIRTEVKIAAHACKQWKWTDFTDALVNRDRPSSPLNPGHWFP